ncbi:MAG: LacI family DNA-binding transcriptional regulator [Candidatus Eiseniibacteriota bacterium]
MATIGDVARAANVSIATVSRALNGSTLVSDATAARVRAAAAELDYWPNSAARNLIRRRTQAIGVLLPDLHGEFFSEVIRGLDGAARRAGLQILLSSSHASADEVVNVARSMRGRVDGLIVMTSDSAAASAVESIHRRFPLVLMNPCFDVDGCPAVSIANAAGSARVARHLLGLGHRSIAILRGPDGNTDAIERLRGFRDAVDRTAADATLVELEGDFTESSGYQAAASLLRRRSRPTAVFATNDSMAIGLIRRLHATGMGVPADMAVVGFDDIAIARYLTPALTTVRVDAHRLGDRAVELLVARATQSSNGARRREVLPAELVIRESCGAAMAAGRGAADGPPEIRSHVRPHGRSRDGATPTRSTGRSSS